MRKTPNLNSLKVLNVFHSGNGVYSNFNFKEIRDKAGGSNTTVLKYLECLLKIKLIKESQLKKFPFTKKYSITKEGINLHKNMLKVLSVDYILGDEGE